MQQWAYVTFDGDNVPMCEVRLVDLPEDFKGMFIHMDHRLVDSSALAVMVADIFQLYMHYQYGADYASWILKKSILQIELPALLI